MSENEQKKAVDKNAKQQKTEDTKTAKRDNRVTLCMITQQLDHYSHGQFLGQSTNEIAQDIIAKLATAQIEIVESHTIVHNKDTQTVWSVKDECYLTTPKTPHFHCVVKFAKRTSIKAIADALGIEQQYVERQKTRGEHALSNMLAYLIHAKDRNKHQYDWREVVSTTNAPFQAYYEKFKQDWEHGANVKTKKSASECVDDIEHDVLTGTLCKQQILLDDELFECYARNKRRIDEAFDSYAERKMMKTIQSMKNSEFCKTVYYVTGKAGVGKSLFTSQLVNAIVDRMTSDGEKWSVCSCASTNPFDEYDGSEILIMDDVRSCALNASDWLKLLDNYNISVGSARYHNKVVAPRVIIINSERDVLEFFYYMKGNGKDGARAEAMDQFFRRILSVIEVLNIEDFLRDLDYFKRMVLPHGGHEVKITGSKRSSCSLDTENECDLLAKILQNESKMTPIFAKDNTQKRSHRDKQRLALNSPNYVKSVHVDYTFDFAGNNLRTIQQIINDKVNEVYARNHLKNA